jgi:hypothetical protein
VTRGGHLSEPRLWSWKPMTVRSCESSITGSHASPADPVGRRLSAEHSWPAAYSELGGAEWGGAFPPVVKALGLRSEWINGEAGGANGALDQFRVDGADLRLGSFIPRGAGPQQETSEHGKRAGRVLVARR